MTEWRAVLRRYALARRRAAQRWARLEASHPMSSAFADRAKQAREAADRAMARVFDEG